MEVYGYLCESLVCDSLCYFFVCIVLVKLGVTHSVWSFKKQEETCRYKLGQ